MTARFAFIGAAITGLLALILTVIPVRATPLEMGPMQGASEPLMCTLATEGMLSQQADKVCKCVFLHAETPKNLPDRFARDCGILRPSGMVVAADLGPPLPPMPPVIITERDRNNDRKRRN